MKGKIKLSLAILLFVFFSFWLFAFVPYQYGRHMDSYLERAGEIYKGGWIINCPLEGREIGEVEFCLLGS